MDNNKVKRGLLKHNPIEIPIGGSIVCLSERQALDLARQILKVAGRRRACPLPSQRRWDWRWADDSNAVERAVYDNYELLVFLDGKGLAWACKMGGKLLAAGQAVDRVYGKRTATRFARGHWLQTHRAVKESL